MLKEPLILVPYICQEKILQQPVAQFVTIFFVSGNDINDLPSFFRQHWPNDTIPSKLHLLEDHAADFMERWSTGHGIYGEQGAESIHKVFNILRRTYSSIQPASKRLESMMNEHLRLVHPDAKSLKPEIKRRKIT